MKVEFVASFSPIVKDPTESQSLYSGALGLAFEGADADYVFTERLPGVKHFGLWPLREAARACFGSDEWPEEVPIPQASVEFEVETPEAVANAATELEQAGYRLLHRERTEPWKQVITRLVTPDGLLVGVCYTPWFHGEGA